MMPSDDGGVKQNTTDKYLLGDGGSTLCRNVTNVTNVTNITNICLETSSHRNVTNVKNMTNITNICLETSKCDKCDKYDKYME